MQQLYLSLVLVGEDDIFQGLLVGLDLQQGLQHFLMFLPDHLLVVDDCLAVIHYLLIGFDLVVEEGFVLSRKLHLLRERVVVLMAAYEQCCTSLQF